jgi:hypothetical protein
VAIVALGLFAFGTAAEAASVKSLLSFDPAGSIENQVSDDSVENLIQRDGNLTLDIGDSVRGIFNITSLGDSSNTLISIGAGTSNNELTGLFQTKVINKTLVFDPTPGAPGSGDERYEIAFGPDPAFAEAAALGIAAAGDGLPGAMVLFYEDPAKDFTKSSGTIATDVTSATTGSFFWALGFTSAVPVGTSYNATTGEGWVAPFSLASVPVGGTIGTADFSLNRVFTLGLVGTAEGWKLLPLAGGFSTFATPSTYTEITGFTSFKGQSTIPHPSGWNVLDNAEFFLNPIGVPVPGAAWMGFALLGVLGLGRRLRRRS